MAALFIIRGGRIGMLILFSTCFLQLFGNVGLLTISAVHPEFQEDSRQITLDEDGFNKPVYLNLSTTFLTHSFESTKTPVGLASLHPCSGLYDAGITLLWSRPRNSIPFRSGPARSISCILVTIILMCGDVECNPGPTSPSFNVLRFGCINICSAIHKTALIQDLMSDHSLNVIALSETTYQSDTPNSILSEVAPDGFSVQHVFRSPTANHPAGGGLAFVHRNNVVIKSVQSGFPTPTSIELQVLRVTSCNPCVTIVNAYRPPERSIATFYDEFQDVILTISASTTDHLLICGDLNAPGSDATSISPGLHDVIETLGLEQLVKSPQ